MTHKFIFKEKKKELDIHKEEKSKCRINNLEDAGKVYKSWRTCKYCGDSHKWGHRFCPWHGKVCTKCGRLNHRANMCRIGYGIQVYFMHGIEYTMILQDQNSWEKFSMTKQYEMTSAEVLRCIGKFSKYKGTDEIPVIFRCKENSTKDYGRQLMMEMSQMTNAYVFETGPAHMDPSLLKKIQQTYHKEKGSNEEMKERKEKVAWNTFGRPIYYDDGTKEYDDGTVVGHDGKVKATREDKEKKVQRYLEFAKEILPEENIQCIWDLRSGKVWLHMLNEMFGKHYKFSKKLYIRITTTV